MDEKLHIVGKLAESEKYCSLNPLFAKAFAFLNRSDLAELPPGKYEIDGDRCWANLMEVDLKSAESCRLEAHRRYIDIQAPVTGDDDEHGFSRLPLSEERGGEVPIGADDVLNGGVEDLKIGPCRLHLGLGMAELGGGDHFHGFGDLLGALHAADAVFDLLGGNTSHAVSLLLCRVELRDQLFQRIFQRLFGFGLQLAGGADGLQHIAVPVFHMLFQPLLKLGDLLYGDVR